MPPHTPKLSTEAGSLQPALDAGCDPIRLLQDRVPTGNDHGCNQNSQMGSIWHALVDAYHTPTGNVVFMSSLAGSGSGPQWRPGRVLYQNGVELIERAVYKADSMFSAPVVFGGVVWNASTGLSNVYHPAAESEEADPDTTVLDFYPWPLYRAELDTLLTHLGDDVFENPSHEGYGGRFYFINTVVPSTHPDFDYAQDSVAQKIDVLADLEADVCAEYAFCSVIQESIDIKLAQLDPDCGKYGSYGGHGTTCDGWYAVDDNGVLERNHWGQRGLNQVGAATGAVAAAHGFRDPFDGGPFDWDVSVEVPMPAAWCTDPECQNVPDVRLDVYDDAGVLIEDFVIAPSIASPDWTASFDEADAGWDTTWSALGTDFLTFEFYREGSPDSLLGQYVYVPSHVAYTGSTTDFFRPTPADEAAAFFEVYVDTTTAERVPGVRARTGHTSGPFFEDAFAGAYVLPYNGDHYETACALDALAVGAGLCPSAHPDYFLARLPDGAARPDVSERRLTFAGEAHVEIPATWGTSGELTWAVDSLVLAFPEDRELIVKGGLTVAGATLTEAEPGQRWGGVVVFDPGVLDFDGVTVELAAVGIDVHSVGNVFSDVLLDGNGVGILTGYTCPDRTGGSCSTRSEFTLTESCVLDSEFDLDDGLEGYGIWARHADAYVSESTVEGNGAYGLRLDEADMLTYRLLLQGNGANSSSGALHGANVRENGGLYLTTILPQGGFSAGENLVENNAGTEVLVDLDGESVVGVDHTSALRNHVAHGADTTGVLVSNDAGNPTLSARKTYWGTTGTPPAGWFSSGTTVNRNNPLTASPSGSAGRPGACTGAGASLSGGGSSGRTMASASARGGPARSAARSGRASGGRLAARLAGRKTEGAGGNPEPESPDPEVTAWLAAEIAALRTAIAAAPDSAALVRALYAVQRLDRDDVLGEHAETMALLASVRAPLAAALVGPDTLTAGERAAGEAALVASVHDALRRSRYDEAGALIAPFSGAGLLPEVEGAEAQRTLALALVALDEQAGEVATALTRLDAVLAGLGPEEEHLARDLAATAALLARRLGEEAPAGRGAATAPQAALASSSSGFPAEYALGQPYPNPFTGRTTVPFALPEASHVEVVVYDLLGRRVAVLADGLFEAGRHAAVLDGRGLAVGVYLVRAVMEGPAVEKESGARAFTRRVTVLR